MPFSCNQPREDSTRFTEQQWTTYAALVGQGLSGTGPKAGGPHYLLRFATEKTVTVNTTAAGGNASLLTLGD